jgi:hypothetical protein
MGVEIGNEEKDHREKKIYFSSLFQNLCFYIKGITKP